MKDKKIIITIITVLFVIVTGILYCFSNKHSSEDTMLLTNEDIPSSVEELATPESSILYVHICGQVKNPGVYPMKVTDRIADAIKMAGGLLKQAAADSVNQAQHLMDGQQIYIPSVNEEKTNIGNTNSGKSSLININTASTEELMSLPGIGEAKAKSIIQYREKNQGFKSIDEIKNIEGIKDGVFRKIQDFITVT